MRMPALPHHLLRWALAALLASCAAAALPATPAATAVPEAPPPNKIMLGMGGTTHSLAQFEATTQQDHHLNLIFANWGQGVTWGKLFGRYLEEAEAGRYRLIVHLGTKRDGREAITPLGIAYGGGDDYLIAASRTFNQSGQGVFIRPMAEMNGHWNVYSAYNANGTKRNAAHSTASYRQAFRRIALIMRGGSVATINIKLGKLGLPKLRTTEGFLPQSGRIAMIWNPQGEGSPNVKGNQPINYYPGNAYVDYVANDLYSINFNAHWKAHNSLYATFPGKPFMIMEYAPWGTDDPAFVKAMFTWAATHGRTKAIVYFNGSASTLFTLARKPKSLATYRAYANGWRFTCPQCTT